MKTKVWKFYQPNEEGWLNEMAAKGLAMTDCNWPWYTFEEIAPGEYIYRMVCMENDGTHAESIRYIRFMEEQEVEHVATYRKEIYFRKKSADGSFEILTDIDSRIKNLRNHVRPILNAIIIEFAILLIWTFVNIAIIGPANMFVPVYVGISIFIGLIIILLLLVLLNYRKKIKHLERERELHEG